MTLENSVEHASKNAVNQATQTAKSAEGDVEGAVKQDVPKDEASNLEKSSDSKPSGPDPTSDELNKIQNAPVESTMPIDKGDKIEEQAQKQTKKPGMLKKIARFFKKD